MKNKEDLRFEIDQLRKDKMVYALDSIATSLAMFFLITFLSLISYKNAQIVVLVGVILAVGFFIFVAIGNIIRFTKIKKLEKALKRIK